MKATEFKIEIYGSICNIKTKKELKFIECKETSSWNGYVYYDYTFKSRNGKIHIFSGSNFIIESFHKSIYYNGHFLGNINQYREGYLADIVSYMGKPRMFKDYESAKSYMINCRFECERKMIFNYLGRYKFSFTQDYLEGLNITQVAYLIMQKISGNRITFNEAIKYAKKFLKTDIVRQYEAGILKREDLNKREYINTAYPVFN